MSDVIVSAMHDARDAEDTRLQAGEHGLLVESYYGVIIDRCRINVRGGDAYLDVAQQVVLRLMAELERGRRYRVPFRVVVHQFTRDSPEPRWPWRCAVKPHLVLGSIDERAPLLTQTLISPHTTKSAAVAY